MIFGSGTVGAAVPFQIISCKESHVAHRRPRSGRLIPKGLSVRGETGVMELRQHGISAASRSLELGQVHADVGAVQKLGLSHLDPK